jgi:hypothetical protein
VQGRDSGGHALCVSTGITGGAFVASVHCVISGVQDLMARGQAVSMVLALEYTTTEGAAGS